MATAPRYFGLVSICRRKSVRIYVQSDSVALIRSAAEAGDDGRLKREQKQVFSAFKPDELAPKDHLMREIISLRRYLINALL
jgi:hypothetical protein